jgi:hypothetical protein
LLKKNGILIEFTFLDGLEFIRNPQKLLLIDYVILDIDLAIQSDLDENECLQKILQDYYGYEPQEDEILDEQKVAFQQARIEFPQSFFSKFKLAELNIPLVGL